MSHRTSIAAFPKSYFDMCTCYKLVIDMAIVIERFQIFQSSLLVVDHQSKAAKLTYIDTLCFLTRKLHGAKPYNLAYP